MNNCNIYILTFTITAIWDVILRYMSENYETLPSWFQNLFSFIYHLKPYFKNHTVLSAALVAGFVGFIAQIIILQVYDVKSLIPIKYNKKTLIEVAKLMGISFLISGLVGFPMKWIKLFPHLENTYYKYLGNFKGFYHDGISGIIVQITLLILLTVYYRSKINN
jgi:hypothetical protein